MNNLKSLHGVAVLVIDDSEIDLAAMASLLSDAGLVVHTLPTPIGATRVAKAHQVQAVVIDQNMPSMDGSKLAALFRGSRAFHDVGLVLVSGDDDGPMNRVVHEVGADAFVAKKAIGYELVDTVVRVLLAKMVHGGVGHG